MEIIKKYIKLVIIIASVSVVFAGAAAYSLVKYTTSEKHFCMSCHRNQGYSDFTKQSALHPRYISCDECHSKNSEIIPTGFNASPELVNENCIRCHGDIISTNDWKSLKTNVHEIRIEHEKHLKNVGLNCVDCHNNIAHDRYPDSTNRPHMSKCFECHVSREEGCETCHPAGFVEVSTETDDVSVTACSECHMDFLRKESNRGEGFLHKKHLVNLMECSTCHDLNAQHPLAFVKQDGCGSCHHKKSEKECVDCHALQNKMYMGIRDDDKGSYPDVMATAGMSCNIGCHVDLHDGHSFKTVEKACITCHDEEHGRNVEGFRASLNKSIENLKELISEIREKTRDSVDTEKIKFEIDGNEEKLHFIEKAKGAHNMKYSLLLVNDVERKLRSLQNQVIVIDR